MFTQQDEGYSEPQTVLAHPWQLRAVCEQFGLTETSHPRAAKTIATLQRRMAGLRDRIHSLAHWMAEHSDHEHADLSQEMTIINALADLAGEWCADFDGDEVAASVQSDCGQSRLRTHAPAPEAQAQAALL